jgi:hypothetical protein
MKTAIIVITILVIIIVTVIVVALVMGMKKNPSASMHGNMYNRNMYNHTEERFETSNTMGALMPQYDFGNMQTGYSGNGLLEITPAKKCCLFPNAPGCENISPEEIACVCCGKSEPGALDDIPKGALIGRPVHFDYTPESNSNWRWTRCNNDSYQTPCSEAPLTPPVL